MPPLGGTPPSLQMLGGIALHVPVSQQQKQQQQQHQHHIWYFPHERLPVDARARFQRLFAARERWTLPELEPYLETLVNMEGAPTQAELLLKYTCIVVEDDGVTGYQTMWFVYWHESYIIN